MKRTLFALMTVSFCSFNLSAIASDVSDIEDFNKEFEHYVTLHPELKNEVEKVREVKHDYIKYMNANHVEESLKLFGLNKLYLAQLEGVFQQYQDWAMSVSMSELKQPTSLLIREAFRSITKEPRPIFDDIKNAPAFSPLLRRLESCLERLTAIEENILRLKGQSKK